MPGIFTLHTVADLLAKLQHDHGRLHRAADDAFAAFDFFVTAEHLPEWMDPPRPDLRQSDPLLQVVSHIASGAKHFEVSDKRHRSVAASGRQGRYWPARYFPRRYWGKYWGVDTLYVELDGDAAAMLGPRVSAVKLADKVLDFWTARLGHTPADGGGQT
jgi:hypothetical protein